MKIEKRRWNWEILVRNRVCVLCGKTIEAGTKAISTTYRGKITLCGECRKRNMDVIEISEYSEMCCELVEG